MHMEFLTQLVLDYYLDCIWISAIWVKTSLDITSLIFWAHYAHALLNLKRQHHFLFGQNNVTFCTTLMNDLSYIYAAIASLNTNNLLRVIPYGDKLIAIY